MQFIYISGRVNINPNLRIGRPPHVPQQGDLILTQMARNSHDKQAMQRENPLEEASSLHQIRQALDGSLPKYRPFPDHSEQQKLPEKTCGQSAAELLQQLTLPSNFSHTGRTGSDTPNSTAAKSVPHPTTKAAQPTEHATRAVQRNTLRQLEGHADVHLEATRHRRYSEEEVQQERCRRAHQSPPDQGQLLYSVRGEDPRLHPQRLHKLH